MSVKKQKYRRLQVENIALRTVFEIVVLIAAIVISCVTVINSYEKSYEESSTETAHMSAMQLAHNISALADAKALGLENAERRDWAQEMLSGQLDQIFLSEDIQYSGGIFTVENFTAELFASSALYGRLYTSAAENEDFAAALAQAAAGAGGTVCIGDTYIALEPVTDPDSGAIYAVSSAAIDYRSSTEFDSPVRNRIVLISVVSGVLILAYFAISGVRSERKKLSGEAV